jgi:hypothetical protein
VRLGALLWDVYIEATIFIVGFSNKMSGTCSLLLWLVFLIIKDKLLMKIPEGQKSAGCYIEKIKRER